MIIYEVCKSRELANCAGPYDVDLTGQATSVVQLCGEYV